MALARAFLRDVDLLILDEPTSSLDPKVEHEIISKFAHLKAGRTTILISHRLSTVKMADRILVLAGGRLVESGTHAELVRQAGI